VAAAILGGGRASRLWSELVYRRRIAQDVTAVSLQPLEDAGLFLAVLTGKPGSSTDELIGALDEIVDRLAAEGPSAAEMERARARLALAHAAALESVAGRADALAHAAALLDDPGYVERRPERLAAVDAAAVRDAVGERLAGAGRAVVDYVPRGG
jgi:predicted Zn-dependent peptidase